VLKGLPPNPAQRWSTTLSSQPSGRGGLGTGAAHPELSTATEPGTGPHRGTEDQGAVLTRADRWQAQVHVSGR